MPIINSMITSGIQPSGTKTITSNGVVDVTNYANADVQVPTTAPQRYITLDVNANGELIRNDTQFVDLNGVTKISEPFILARSYQTQNITSVDFGDVEEISNQIQDCYVCYEMCKGNTHLTSADLSSVVTISGAHSTLFSFAFEGCTSLTTMNLSSLETIGGNVCQGLCKDCSSLTSFIAPKLKTVGGYGLSGGCKNCNLSTIDLPSLEVVHDYGMQSFASNNTNLSSFNLDKLTTNGTGGIGGFFASTALTTASLKSLKQLGYIGLNGTFNKCLSLRHLYLPALSTTVTTYTNGLRGVFSSDMNGVTVHFPSNLQSLIGDWSDIINGMGGTNTVILWDLPATVLLTGTNSVVYERNPKDDTATSLAWRKNIYNNGFVSDWTPFYTSGTTDPQVGDTIYSDSACTTAVTTISSIV